MSKHIKTIMFLFLFENTLSNERRIYFAGNYYFGFGSHSINNKNETKSRRSHKSYS